MLIWRKKYCFPWVYFLIDGQEYTFQSGWGCQLLSFEWKRVPAGTRRTLKLDHSTWIEVTVFTTRRPRWFKKVEITWAVSNSGTHDEHTARIHELRDSLRKLI